MRPPSAHSCVAVEGLQRGGAACAVRGDRGAACAGDVRADAGRGGRAPPCHGAGAVVTSRGVDISRDLRDWWRAEAYLERRGASPDAVVEHRVHDAAVRSGAGTRGKPRYSHELLRARRQGGAVGVHEEPLFARDAFEAHLLRHRRVVAEAQRHRLAAAHARRRES